nr:MAG TPA: hypothetical protein [Caudoviricetes sp.]
MRWSATPTFKSQPSYSVPCISFSSRKHYETRTRF